MTNRMYSHLTQLAFDDAQRIFDGIATTPRTDRMEDKVNPLGGKFDLKQLPFLMQHDASPESSVGHVIAATPTKDGIKVRVKIESDPLLPELDKAWARIKKGLVRGLSIGFRPLAPPKPIKGTMGVLYDEWEWLELSGVVIAANADASITMIKSLDDRQRAASGNAQKVVIPPALGRTGSNPPNPKGNRMKTYNQAMLVGIDEAITTKKARATELFENKPEEGFSEDQRAEFEGLQQEIRNLNDERAVCEMHVANIATARPVIGSTRRLMASSRNKSTSKSASRARPVSSVP